MIGQRVNNFEIVRLIGEGGMGTVYEAKHRLIRRKVAIKVLRHEFTRDLDLVKRFFNEARATSEIRHPNIIEIVDVGTLADGVPFLVMEMLEGESLAERLAEVGRLDPAHVAYWASQAADALQAAHGNAIIHRDLKPDNLFLARDESKAAGEYVKVLDFGIAKLRGDPSGSSVRTSPGAVLGTPAYMSPEQCRGNADEIGPATDIYSLGVIMYEMLCGEPPFMAVGLGEVLMMHMSAVAVPPSKRLPDVPLDLEAVILKALAKQAHDRFESMAELAIVLQKTQAFARAAAAPAALVHVPRPASELVPARAPGAPWSSEENVPTLLSPADSAASNPLGETLVGGGASLKPITIPSKRWQATLRAVGGVLVVATVLGALLLFATRMREREVAVNAKLATGLTKALQNFEPPRHEAHARSAPEPAKAVILPGTTGAARSKTTTAHHARAEPDPTTEVRSASMSSEPAPTPESPAPKPEAGFLSLDSSPWAIVSTGGRPIGTTPLVRISLPPGRHVLKLENPELGRSTSYTVEIQPGKNVSRFVGWGNE